MGKRKDTEERIRALREEPAFRELVDALKKLPQDRIDAFYDECAPREGDKEDAPDEDGEE